MENLAILVPLKDFHVAKRRLREGGMAGVNDVSRSLAERVLAASRPRRVIVACESSEVADFAIARGAEVVESRARGLNEAVANAYRIVSPRFSRIIIAHGDLREPEGLGVFVPLGGVTVFADSHGKGTNVLALPSGIDFNFHFGHDSASAHQREAQRLGLEIRIVFDSPWRFDVDEPEDLLSK